MSADNDKGLLPAPASYPTQPDGDLRRISDEEAAARVEAYVAGQAWEVVGTLEWHSSDGYEYAIVCRKRGDK